MQRTGPIRCRFLRSVSSIHQCPSDEHPEIAFAGRSNSGKSSTLNRITGSKNLARVSKTPGRTQLINLFAVEGGGRLVDLPGYGYAKASQQAQSRWSQLVDTYLNERSNLIALVITVDIRRGVQNIDLQMIEWTLANKLPLLLLLNKADKLSRSNQANALVGTTESLQNHDTARVDLFSATTGLGTDGVREYLRQHLSQD